MPENIFPCNAFSTPLHNQITPFKTYLFDISIPGVNIHFLFGKGLIVQFIESISILKSAVNKK